MDKKNKLPDMLYCIFVLLFIGGSLWMDKLLRFPKLLPSPLNIIVSLPFIGSGFFLTLWTILLFYKTKGTPFTFNPPPQLITTGPYAYVRNPMLAGMFIGLLGIGILFRSITIVFIFIPLFILYNVIEVKFFEEPELEKRLGKEYIEYKKKTPMFIPRLSRKK